MRINDWQMHRFVPTRLSHRLVEVLLGSQDAPRALREQASLTEKANAEVD